MSDRIEKAYAELSKAVTGLGEALVEETQGGLVKAKDMGLPFLTGLLAQAVGAVAMVQSKIAGEPAAAANEKGPLGGPIGSVTQEQIETIKLLMQNGKSDEQIAEVLKVDIKIVQLFR